MRKWVFVAVEEKHLFDELDEIIHDRFTDKDMYNFIVQHFEDDGFDIEGILKKLNKKYKVENA